MGAFDYKRRQTDEVKVGPVGIGGDNPVRLQSMTNTSTMDTPGSVAQCERIHEAGADIVRLTAQGVREAENIGKIRAELREKEFHRCGHIHKGIKCQGNGGNCSQACKCYGC